VCRVVQVLRVRAETHVLVWDHVADLLHQGEGEGEVTMEYLRATNEFIRLRWVNKLLSVSDLL